MNMEENMDWLIAIGATFHLFLAPYTKVEESFNIQASHDILYHGFSIKEYDHLEYPGVVPRTFLGPFMVSFFSWPFTSLIRVFGISKCYSQYIVRLALVFLVFGSWRMLRKQISEIFGTSVGLWYSAITASQFHFIYYMGRPLPNSFGLIFALLSFKFWLKENHEKFVICSGIAILIFRAELLLLLGPMLLYDLSKKRVSIVRFLRIAIRAGIGCVCVTIILDSFMWQRFLWPELEVLLFNTYNNQSSNWGVYPLLWYWYSCLPRGLGLSLFLVPIGALIDFRIQGLISPALIFVALYSFLPHKELRFIIYVFPMLNVAAARACHFFWISRHKSNMRKFLAICSCLHILGNFALSAFFLIISSRNYPGGDVIFQFHELVHESESVNVHIDNFAAQTGVTRFMQLNDNWRYNKTENLKAGSSELLQFTHLILEAKSKYAYNLKHYTNSHQIIGFVNAFSHLYFDYQSFPPVKIRVKPAIYILKRLADETSSRKRRKDNISKVHNHKEKYCNRIENVFEFYYDLKS